MADGNLDTLIEALQIFRKYGNPTCPTHCEHDELRVMIEYDDVSEEDRKRLDELHFSKDEFGMFVSYWYGSA